jgi:hypothetical protein
MTPGDVYAAIENIITREHGCVGMREHKFSREGGENGVLYV